jgi:hypothetical protein
MSHVNAALTPRARLRLAQLVVDGGWTYAAAAKFMVAPRTAKKWADRYRCEGVAGMSDRSSRPHPSPTKTSPDLVRRMVRLRWRHRLGPVQIGAKPVPRWALRRNEHVRTDPRPTARSNAFTAPSPMAEPTRGSMTQKPLAERHCLTGSTSTITAEPTPR